MGIIQCSHDCVHQLDGYCCLDGQAVVNNPDAANGISCVHYKARKKSAGLPSCTSLMRSGNRPDRD